MNAMSTGKSHWYIGIDFGLVHDHTAVTVLERTETMAEDGTISSKHEIREIKRVTLGTPYTEASKRVAHLAGRLTGRVFVAADATGVGRPIIEMLREALPKEVALLAVVITGGVKGSGEGNVARVPKRELILQFAASLQSGTLTITSGVEHASILLDELRSFRFKATVFGNETFEAWREKDHDDIVFAAAMADWAATNYWYPIIPRPIKVTAKKVINVNGESTLTMDEAWKDHGRYRGMRSGRGYSGR